MAQQHMLCAYLDMVAKHMLSAYLQETIAARKAARRAERDALGRGEMPDSLKDWRVSLSTHVTPCTLEAWDSSGEQG